MRILKRKNILKILLGFFFVCFINNYSTAQVAPTPQQEKLAQKDTTKIEIAKKASVKYVTEQELDRNISLHWIDTTLDGTEIFHNLYKNYTVFQDLGNIGSPSRPLLFNVERNTGFHLCENPFMGYWMKPEDTKYYSTKTPYSDLSYAQGSNELLYLLARHSQNILPRWNIGADLQRITSIGFLGRQYTSLYSYQFFTRFTSKNKKYDAIANVTWNQGLVEESGGISSDTSFESLTAANKKVYTNLASGSQTRFKSRFAQLKQYYHFGSLQPIIRDEDTLYEMRSNSQLSYSFKVEEISYIFENLKGDTNSFLLPHQYYDTIQDITFDSTYYGRMENRIDYHVFNLQEKMMKDSLRTYMNFGLAHHRFVVSQNPYVRNYQNIIGDFTFENIHLKNYTLSSFVFSSFCFIGYNEGDYKLSGDFRYRLPFLDFGFGGRSQLYRPDFLFQRFKTNQFLWENSFDKIYFQNLGVNLSTRKLRQNFHLKLNSYLLNNWVYVGTDQLPARASSPILIYTVELKKTFQLWKFYFDHYIIYQNTNSVAIIHLPDLSGKLHYYFQSKFKGMRFQVGFDVFYNTAYYANDYNPATRLFFLQNERLIGNYPLIDPFVTGAIRRAEFFAKYEHVNQDWFSLNGYYYTPHYPISLSSFRIGIRWRFYD